MSQTFQEMKRGDGTSRASWRWAGILAASVLLEACGVHWVGPGYGARGRYALDSVTAGCRQNPALCTQSSESVSSGTVSKASMAVAVTSATVATTAATLWTLDETLRRIITQELEQCANEARSSVLVRRSFTKSPTPEECRAQALDAQGKPLWDTQGQPMTLARQLGKEVHDAAFQCAQERLSSLVPGKFSLEPRYRYTRSSKQTTFISAEEEQALLQAGGEQLKGTLKPDVVIHTGNPVEAKAVYDFKFPCIDISTARWPRQAEGPLSQGALYAEALHATVYMVLPWLGAIP